MSIGEAGEQFAALAFVKAGMEVYWPAGVYGADMVVCIGGHLYKVQVKSTGADPHKAKFRFRDTFNRGYESGTVDYFAAVHPGYEAIALVPADREFKSCTIDFDNVRPEWDFVKVIERLREGGTE